MLSSLECFGKAKYYKIGKGTRCLGEDNFMKTNQEDMSECISASRDNIPKASTFPNLSQKTYEDNKSLVALTS